MATDDALLRAVLADPDDDAPRLIYADWLDEHGDCDRAEFIRIQCELARMNESNPRYPQLRQRQGDLLAGGNYHRWVAPLEEMAQQWTFCRGFVEEIEVAAAVFLKCGERLFDAAPVRSVKLVRVGLSGPRLAACPALARVGSLDLSGSHLWASHLALLLTSPHLAGLRELSLAHNNLSLSGVTVLTGVRSLNSLTRLELRDNRLHNAGAIRIAACEHLSGLRVLGLGFNGIGVAGANALAASPNLDNLSLLDMVGNYSIDEGREALRARFGDRLRL
jgi:uncharacterized protein (TIGR02996 family)